MASNNYSIDAEQAVLGGLMLNNKAFEDIRKKLNADDFYYVQHRTLFNLFSNLAKEDKPFDIVIIIEALKKIGKLQEIGGEIFLYELLNNTPSAANINAYADEVLEKACKRQFLDDTPYAENLSFKEKIQVDIDKKSALLERLNNNSGSIITFRKLSDIEAKPVQWLWKERIAKGKVSMLAGNPGLGKSQITARIAAIVTTGGKFPVDRSQCEKGGVIFLSAEDCPADTIRPRLEAAGGNLDKVFIMEAVSDKNNKAARTFNFKTDLIHLDAALSNDEYKDVNLIIVDPISAYLGNVDSHRNSDIRALLTPLAELAAKHEVAVLCVSHLNKGSGQEALLRVTGSLAFVAAARAAFVVVKDKEDPHKRLFLPIKNNNGNDKTGLAFKIESYQLSNGIETSRINWLDEVVTTTADEAMSLPVDNEESNALEETKTFLKDLLGNGVLSAKNIRKEAEEAGYSWRTVQRAKKDLDIRAIKRSMSEGWVWQLPPKDAKNPEERQAKSLASFGKFGALRESEGLNQSFDNANYEII